MLGSTLTQQQKLDVVLSWHKARILRGRGGEQNKHNVEIVQYFASKWEDWGNNATSQTIDQEWANVFEPLDPFIKIWLQDNHPFVFDVSKSGIVQ